MLARSPFVCTSLGRALPRDFQQSEIKKYNLRYLAINKQGAEIKFQKKGKIANETPNQCACQRPGLGESTPG